MNNEKGEEGHNDTDAVQTEILKYVTHHLHVNLEDFALLFVLLQIFILLPSLLASHIDLRPIFQNTNT